MPTAEETSARLQAIREDRIKRDELPTATVNLDYTDKDMPDEGTDTRCIANISHNLILVVFQGKEIKVIGPHDYHCCYYEADSPPYYVHIADYISS